MASSKLVPSRAALLRGVILTTSCSVVLLAEERRRRVKIARAAIENARMLHLANSACHSACHPLALVDARRETLPPASFSRPRTSARRCRRRLRPRLSPSDCPVGDGDSSGAVLSARTAEAGALLPPLADILADLRSRVSKLLGPDALLRTRPETLRSWRGSEISSKLHAEFSVKSTCDPTQLTFSLNNAKTAPEKLGHLGAQARVETYSAPAEESAGSEGLGAAEPAKVLLASSTPSSIPQAFCDDVLVMLQQLQHDFSSHRPGAEVLDRLQSVIAALQKLASLGQPTATLAGPLTCAGTNLLRRALEHDRDGASVMVDSLLRLCESPINILIALAEFMDEGGCSTYMKQALGFLSKPASGRRWMGGRLVHRLLEHHHRSQGDYQHTKRLYQALLNAGLFLDFNVFHATEHEIRVFMASKAIEQGDDALLSVEMRAFQAMAPDAVAHDRKLQRLLLVGEATLGQWDFIHDRIEMLWRCVGMCANRLEFQEALTHVTDILARSQTPEKLKSFVQRTVSKYQTTIKHDWVFTVFDWYASRRQADSAFSWLHFCCDNDLVLDGCFLQDLYSRCRKYWCFSDRSIEKLQKRLDHVVALDSELDALRRRKQWSTVKPTRDSAVWATTARGDPSMPNSRRLAGFKLCSKVRKLLRVEKTGVQEAIAAVKAAHLQGLDVSEAMTPISIARLKGGDDPGCVVHEALQMGVRVHGSTFNKASQALAARGDFEASAEMCRIAARENATGDLAYDEYNFSNLVFAYTGSGKYDALRKVLSEFTSEVLWWRGGRVSLESIKLAMKTVAMRAVVFAKEEARHREALDRLDEAFMHVKRCRATRDDRRVVADTLVRIMGGASGPGRAVTSRDMPAAVAVGAGEGGADA